MKYLPVAILLSAALYMSACNSPKSATTTPVADSTVVDSAVATMPIEETYWRLTELMGKPVGPTPADKKEVHIRLRKEGNKLEAFAGCNGVGGTYELKPMERISFTNMIGTMMACDDLAIENSLLEVLRTADNYNLNGNKLVLNKARMAPLARFEGVQRPQ